MSIGNVLLALILAGPRPGRQPMPSDSNRSRPPLVQQQLQQKAEAKRARRAAKRRAEVVE